jgi:uncharacterized protein
MKFSLDHSAGLSVLGYADGQVTVAIPERHPLRGVVNLEQDEYGRAQIRDSFIITRQQLSCDWPPENIGQLRPEHLQALLGYAPEVILLGTGGRLSFPAAATLAPLHSAGVGVEVMDTAAACRTFNILAGEGREVLAAMFMI